MLRPNLFFPGGCSAHFNDVHGFYVFDACSFEAVDCKAAACICECSSAQLRALSSLSGGLKGYLTRLSNSFPGNMSFLQAEL